MRHDGRSGLASQLDRPIILNILLTGAAGFTGRHFAIAASNAGHQVTPLRADLLDKSALEEELDAAEVDAVVHLAGISFVGHEDKRAFYDVNLFGTLNLLDALKPVAKKLSRVLLASSANVYGNCDASPIGESQPPAPANHYAMSKLAMEHLARNRLQLLPILIARPFNYTGPGQDSSFLIPKLVNHFVQKADCVELGNLDVEREFNDVRMVCNAYLRLLEWGDAGETYNVCTGNPHSVREVLDHLTRLTGHSLEARIHPSFVRANELHSLCGNPAKLKGTIGDLLGFELGETLAWMLAEAGAPTGPPT